MDPVLGESTSGGGGVPISSLPFSLVDSPVEFDGTSTGGVDVEGSVDVIEDSVGVKDDGMTTEEDLTPTGETDNAGEEEVEAPQDFDAHEVFDAAGKAIRWRSEDDQELQDEFPEMPESEEIRLAQIIAELNHIFDPVNVARIEKMENTRAELDATKAQHVENRMQQGGLDHIGGPIADKFRQNFIDEAERKFEDMNVLYSKKEYGYEGDFKQTGFTTSPTGVGDPSQSTSVMMTSFALDDEVDDEVGKIYDMEVASGAPTKGYAVLQDEGGREAFVPQLGFDSTPPQLDTQRLYEGFTYEVYTTGGKPRKMRKGPSGRHVTDSSLMDKLLRGGAHFRPSGRSGKTKFRRVKAYWMENDKGELRMIKEKKYESMLKRNEAEHQRLYEWYGQRQAYIDKHAQYLDDPALASGAEWEPQSAPERDDVEQSDTGVVRPNGWSDKAMKKATKFFEKKQKKTAKEAKKKAKGKSPSGKNKSRRGVTQKVSMKF